MSTAIDDVIAERTRQIEKEGWTREHDSEHSDHSLSLAAACYAMPEESRRYVRRQDIKEDDRTVGVSETVYSIVPEHWPLSWAGWHWKPKDRRRDLVRAAALLIAEIERIDAQAEHS